MEIYKLTVTTNLRFMWPFVRKKRFNKMQERLQRFSFIPQGWKLFTFSWHTNMDQLQSPIKSGISTAELKIKLKQNKLVCWLVFISFF